MKVSVLNKVLDSYRAYGQANEYEIIAFSSLCDFIEDKRILNERLATSFAEDLAFLIKEYDNFSLIENKQNEICDAFVNKDNMSFYTKLKEESFINRASDERNLDIVDLLTTKIRAKFYSLSLKNKFSESIANWMTGKVPGKKAYCPFNNLIDVEQYLSAYCDTNIADVNRNKLFAELIYLTCKDFAKVDLYNQDVLSLIQRTNKYDIGFSFPPIAIPLEGKRSELLENVLLEDMLAKISGRFCIILRSGFAFQGGNIAGLRRKIISSNRLKTVVGLPSGFVPYSGVTFIALFFDKYEKNQEELMFIDLSKDKCRDTSVGLRTFEFNYYAIEVLEKGLYGIETDCSKKVQISELEKEDFNLVTSRYVLSEQEEAAQQQILEGDTKLVDVVDIYRAQASKTESDGELFYEVSAADINAVGIIEKPEKQLILSQTSPVLKNKISKDDIVFAIKGSVGKVGLVTEEQSNWLVNQSFVILRVKDKKWPVEYVFRQLKSDAMKQYVVSKAYGNVIRSLSMADLKNLPLISPTDEEVRKQKEKHETQIEIYSKIKELEKQLNELNDF